MILSCGAEYNHHQYLKSSEVCCLNLYHLIFSFLVVQILLTVKCLSYNISGSQFFHNQADQMNLSCYVVINFSNSYFWNLASVELTHNNTALSQNDPPSCSLRPSLPAHKQWQEAVEVGELKELGFLRGSFTCLATSQTGQTNRAPQRSKKERGRGFHLPQRPQPAQSFTGRFGWILSAVWVLSALPAL